jgi:polyketide biosynthesis acyl carrier protein
MEKEPIFEALKISINDVLGDQEKLTYDSSLKELGANSVDRAVILMQTLEQLGVQMPMVVFAGAKNLGDIVQAIQNAPKG